MYDSKWQFSLRALFVVMAAVAMVAALIFYATVNSPLCGLLIGFFALAGAMYILLRVPSPLPLVVIVRIARRAKSIRHGEVSNAPADDDA